jgi:hypothetical protein
MGAPSQDLHKLFEIKVKGTTQKNHEEDEFAKC